MQIQSTILKCLLFDEEYRKKVVPHLNVDYFQNEYKIIFNIIHNHIVEYNKPPTSDEISVSLEHSQIHENEFDNCIEIISSIYESRDEMPDTDWAIKESELYVKNRAMYETALVLIDVIEGTNKDVLPTALPEMMKQSVTVSFDSSVGHDYFECAEEQYDYYHDEEIKFPSKLDIINKITDGGIPSKTLNILLAGINVGKTIWLVDVAADYFSRGKNVLFITLEMPENQIRQRIDANLMNLYCNDMRNIPKDSYMSRIKKISEKSCGNLVIKELPSGVGHSGHISHIINELKLRKGWVPDLLCVDYIGIMASSKLKLAHAAGNTNTYYSEVAKELHAMAKLYDLTIWTAQQVDRGSQTTSDYNINNVASAIGISATADFMLAAINNEELEDENKLILKQIKNRYNRKNTYRKSVVGINRGKMSFFNIEQAQNGNVENKPDSVPRNDQSNTIDYG